VTPPVPKSKASAIVWLRSWVYLVLFLTWTIGAAIVCLPVLLRQQWSLAVIRMWVRANMAMARIICGVTFRAEGLEHLPKGACIIAAQHQSSFETYRLFMELEHPVFVLKRELVLIPIIGWYMTRAGLVSVDRSAGATAMRKMLRAAQAAIDAGNQVVIFPEGTRTAPGEKRPYRPGVAALYAHCTAPVIPMALNSGFFWGKTRVLKLPGEIVFKFAPALPAGLDRDAMLAELRARIDEADRELLAGLPRA
jgi:1-acyl-sn-glycerol-3-phosphate acyltransferase